ncbi:hypothetical protein FNB15_05570 [Ferrovibrio terrae]|uniref:Uncharacterized protein n=1 Tax=Ferrovibrio terrae TaxID=2594003 RepID=A0A516GZ26_9PROT|nr:hypothetical protein [Ferrovibrio terrae]QDO96779.1 hypothetical protein FNB15_05570 [Ferrovibrio terrae]
MTESLNHRFESVASTKLAALTELYNELEARPGEPGDKALYQRQSAAKAVLTHIVLLRKLLHLDVPTKTAAGNDTLDIAGYRAMVADLDAASLDEESERG